MSNQNPSLARYFHGVETMEDLARAIPERYFNPNQFRAQTQGRFTSYNTSAGFHGFTNNRVAPDFNKDAQRVKVFNNKLYALGNEVEGINISTLDQETCKIFIKCIDDLKTMFNGVELLGLPTARFTGK